MTRVKIYLCLAATAVIIARASAQSSDDIGPLISGDSARLVEMYKDLHRNPELGFMEVRTAGIVAGELRSLGCEVKERIGKTGVVGILRNGKGPVVLYRADMDCNSVKETTGLPYASTRIVKKDDGTETPVMHACGHDVHVTWMLGVAKIMSRLKSRWRGTLVFLAQPAEELLLGASAMVNDGLYENGVPVPDFLFAMHTWPTETGTIFNGAGIRSSGSDQLDVIFHGVGGHGSAPERTTDPVLMACMAVSQYQAIVSRQVPPQEVSVLTVSSIHAGTDYNVIPSIASLKLNLRWFTEATRNTLLEGIRSVNAGLAASYRLPPDMHPEVRMKGNAFPLLNDTVMVQRINAGIAKAVPRATIISDMPPIMGSEDFPVLARVNKKAAYDYLFLGVVHPDIMKKAREDGKKIPFYLHSSDYRVDVSAIPLGTKVGVSSLLEIFGGKSR